MSFPFPDPATESPTADQLHQRNDKTHRKQLRSFDQSPNNVQPHCLGREDQGPAIDTVTSLATSPLTLIRTLPFVSSGATTPTTSANTMLTPSSPLHPHTSPSSPSSPSLHSHPHPHHLHQPQLTPTKSSITATITTLNDSGGGSAATGRTTLIKSDKNFNVETRNYKSPMSVSPSIPHQPAEAGVGFDCGGVPGGGGEMTLTVLQQPKVIVSSSPISLRSPAATIDETLANPLTIVTTTKATGTTPTKTQPHHPVLPLPLPQSQAPPPSSLVPHQLQQHHHHNEGNLNIFNMKTTDEDNDLLYNLNRTPSISFCCSSIDRDDEDDELTYEDNIEDFDDRINDDDEDIVINDDDDDDDEDDDDEERDEDDDGHVNSDFTNNLYQSLSELELKTNVESLHLFGHNNQSKKLQRYLHAQRQEQQRQQQQALPQMQVGHEQELHPAHPHHSPSQPASHPPHIQPQTQKFELTNQQMDQKSNNFLLNFNNIPGCCVGNTKQSKLQNLSLSSSPENLIINSSNLNVQEKFLLQNDQNSLGLVSTTATATPTTVAAAPPPSAPPTKLEATRSFATLRSPSATDPVVIVAGAGSECSRTSPTAPIAMGTATAAGPAQDTAISTPSSSSYTNTSDLFNIINKLTPTTLSSPSSSNNPFLNYYNNNISGASHNQKCSGNSKNNRNPFLNNHSDNSGSCMHFKRDEFLKATMKICLVVSPPSSKLQLKSKSLTHLDRLDQQLNDDSNIIVNTNSKVSSSEYFSVFFDTENGLKDELFIPATKGVTLADALKSALSAKSLCFSQISVIDNGLHHSNELGTPQFLGQLDGKTDVSNLAGRSLILSERDNAKKSPHYIVQKAASVGFRTRHGKLFSSASTDDSGEQQPMDHKLSSGKQVKQKFQLSQLWGNKNPQQNQLCEILNKYMKSGVPKSKNSFHNQEFNEALKELKTLPNSWTDIVNCTGMSEIDTTIQSAIWELVTTEVDYIHALQTVTDLFLACLEGIQVENILTKIDQNKLFSNIRDICEANLKFWSLYLFPMVKYSKSSGQPMCIDYFQKGFITFSSIFSPYAKYCAEQSTCQYYCKELSSTDPLFTSYLAWCESQKECNRLRLADILVRPMQRLTKYSLLLTAIRKHISDENTSEIMDEMIHSVEEFVCSVNSHLTTRQENERLKGIMARIENYDVVDSNNEHLDKMVKQYSIMFDLCAPMKGCALAQGRHLFMEGDLKYKDTIGKLDVHCFLLTDILLVCKATTKKGHGNLKVVRQPYMTDKLTLKLKENILYCVYLNDYNMVTAAFTLQCTEAKSWHDSITKAKHIYTRLKQGSPWDISFNNKFGNSLANNNISSANNNDSLSIKKSPLNSSIGSRVSSLNNSHSGSVELNETKNVSIDFEKANSLSSDEGCSLAGTTSKHKITPSVSRKLKPITSNSLTVQYTHLGQSMPNLNQTINNNTLLVPGTTSAHSKSHTGQSNLLSPSQRGISYPPPSPTRATLRRGFAVSSSTKNPPLVKTRNVTSVSCGWGGQQQQQQQQQSALLHNFQSTSLINTMPPAGPSQQPHILQQQSLQLFEKASSIQFSRNNSNDTSDA